MRLARKLRSARKNCSRKCKLDEFLVSLRLTGLQEPHRQVGLFATIGTLLHGYANPLKRRDTTESINLHNCLIPLDSCRIHSTRRQNAQKSASRNLALSL